ncbi:N-acetyltransferase [Pseudomonas sp. M30-35]|uniref:GNAT family N-acetyltransferase n=1 Tax=Pseudomonas sp. M30-35 TaxID=1981174 RepID=UPI000B3D3110|nr:GNAT family N-acetyltransferase [Pseudomonas sp. M30-35]ARU86938.1 GNAT family N-acetyltransferase [Pseudomonas sp. M30-35]
MHIIQATAGDLDQLSHLFVDYLTFYQVDKPLNAAREFLAARIEQGNSTIFISRDDTGNAQGFVQLYPLYASLALAPMWLLSDLYVNPTVRRQGIGEALMNAARDHAQASGACGLQLETAKNNYPGQALYQRLGYVRDEAFYTYWLAVPSQ